MAKMTLLEMVQDILNDMDSDPVDAIDDTEESIQVAQIVKTTYFRLLSGKDYPFLRTLTTLTQTSGSTPTTMTIPATMSKVYWIRYNKKPVEYMAPEAFKAMVDAREVETDVVDANGFAMTRDPLYWTTYDDQSVVFDGYDADTESYLATAKAVVYGLADPTWTHTGASTPTLPAKMFPTLLSDAKGTAFLVLKQQANAKEESEARRGKVRMQREAWRANDGEPNSNQVNYGRR